MGIVSLLLSASAMQEKVRNLVTRMRYPLIAHLRSKLRYYLGDLDPLTVLLCLAILAALFFGISFLRTRRRPTRKECVYGVLFCLYATAVLSITLLGRDDGTFRSQTEPFASFSLLLNGTENSIVDTLFNVILFFPLGILLSCRLRIPWTCLLIIATTLTIETAQMLTGRGLFEASDVLANILGGGIGIGSYYAFGAVKHRIKRRVEPTGPKEAPHADTNETEQGE